MSLELFVAAIVVTLATVGTALLYLRGITRRVLALQCGHDTGAEFWLRSADVLAVAGSLILVLAFGSAASGADWVQQMRLVLGLALAGIFVTVVLVASNVWRAVPEAAQRAGSVAALPTSPSPPTAATAPISPSSSTSPSSTANAAGSFAPTARTRSSADVPEAP